jgi:ABC-type sugar transport system permease subunit
MSISYWIYTKTTGAAAQPELASATGLVFTMLGLPIVFIVKKLTKITEGD